MNVLRFFFFFFFFTMFCIFKKKIFFFICRFVLVFRLGGVSCDVTVVRVIGGLFSIVVGVSDYKLGGDNFTEVLLTHLQGEFKR